MLKYLFILLLVAGSTQVNAQCACCAGAASGSAFGDINNGMLTLERHQFGAELYSDYRIMNTEHAVEEENASTSTHTHTHEHPHTGTENAEEETLLENMLITSAGIRYGVTGNFMLSAQIPYTILYTANGNDDGLGDLVMTGTYSVIKKSFINLAVIGGVELPTGIQKASSFDNTTVVLGSGSWDPMAGLALSKRWNKVLFNATGLYKFTTNGFEGNNYGDLSVQNVSLTYMISDAACYSADSLPGKSFGITAGVGYYGEWLETIIEEDVRDMNSGYYLGYATANVKFSFRTWSMPMTFSLPVIQNLNGNQNNAGNRYRIGLVKTF